MFATLPCRFGNCKLAVQSKVGLHWLADSSDIQMYVGRESCMVNFSLFFPLEGLFEIVFKIEFSNHTFSTIVSVKVNVSIYCYNADIRIYL